MKRLFLLLAIVCCCFATAKEKPWSVRIAESEMIRNPDPSHLDFVTTKKWNYTNGLVCQAMLDLYDTTADVKYLDYTQKYADSMIMPSGEILTYKLSNYNIDHVNSGKMLLRLNDKRPMPQYKIALETLWKQLESHPRTPEGGFWHKKVYPQQMWLDGIYMGDVFYAEYLARYGDKRLFDDVVKQFTLIAEKTYDPTNGLYRHAWDAAKAQKWADPATGQAPHAWGRAMGWYVMAIVDALDVIPDDHKGRADMIKILNTAMEALVKIQDKKTGGWYQVLDRSGDSGNYIETTCTSMFSYAMLKGVRKGYLDRKYLKPAKKAYEGLLTNFVTIDEKGLVSLTRCCAVAGLGGTPYRDGSYEYYINETIRDNDPKGIGPLIMSSLEYEKL